MMDNQKGNFSIQTHLVNIQTTFGRISNLWKGLASLETKLADKGEFEKIFEIKTVADLLKKTNIRTQKIVFFSLKYTLANINIQLFYQFQPVCFIRGPRFKGKPILLSAAAELWKEDTRDTRRSISSEGVKEILPCSNACSQISKILSLYYLTLLIFGCLDVNVMLKMFIVH